MIRCVGFSLREKYKDTVKTVAVFGSSRRDESSPHWSEAYTLGRPPVRGCMVIKPYGYALWENIQRELDALQGDRPRQRCTFPMLIPMSFFQRGPARRGLLAGAGGGHHGGGRSWRSRWSSAPPRRRSSATCTPVDPELPRPAAALNQWATWCAGRCARGRSCARPSSCGRRGTPPTPRGGGAAETCGRCSTSTPTSPRTRRPSR
jgi:hypothetical protein